MKKFLMLLMAITMLGAGTAQAFPGHGGGHYRPSHSARRPVIIKERHHSSGTALAVAGTIFGVAALASLFAPSQPVQTVQTYQPAIMPQPVVVQQPVIVQQPVVTSNCTTTVNAYGMTVRQCVNNSGWY